MGKPGPLPKDNKLRLIDNDWGNRKTPPSPSSDQPRKPIMPTGLDEAAKREWRRVADRLWKMGVLTEIDKGNLALYCTLVSRLERYDAFLDQEGETYTTPGGTIKPRPEVTMRDNAIREIRQFTKMFGLSHDARCRMTLPQADGNEMDEFESMLD